MESADKPNYFLEQLGSDTADKLMKLDLANKPEAQMPLLQFLAAMGVSGEALKESPVAKALKNRKDYQQLVEDQGVKQQIDAMGLGI